MHTHLRSCWRCGMMPRLPRWPCPCFHLPSCLCFVPSPLPPQSGTTWCPAARCSWRRRPPPPTWRHLKSGPPATSRWGGSVVASNHGIALDGALRRQSVNWVEQWRTQVGGKVARLLHAGGARTRLPVASEQQHQLRSFRALPRPPQASSWLGSRLSGLVRLEVGPGDTLLLPSAWPHAVSTPEAAVAVGECHCCFALLWPRCCPA